MKKDTRRAVPADDVRRRAEVKVKKSRSADDVRRRAEVKVKKSRSADSVRRRAEGIVKKSRPAGAPVLADAELRRLLHELQVHQVELEMQNEELRNTQAELAALLAKYTDLYDFAPVGFLTVDGDGVILEMNLAAAGLLGLERQLALHRRLDKFVATTDRSVLPALLARLQAATGKQICELELGAVNGERRYVRIEAVAVAPSGDAPPAAFRLAILDISESQRLKSDSQRHSAELQRALDLIKKLQGILPICSYCHRIRNENQVWERLEEYISSHSGAKFTHGICSVCMAEHYPNIVGKE